MTYPTPFDETRRQRVLDETGMLETPRHPDLDALTELAAERYAVPCANISLVDRERQWYASVVGPEMVENPRTVGFCAHTITQDRPLIVLDAAADPRFASNPAVTQGGIRFYAGAQVVVDGAAIGTFCLMDTKPRAAFDAEAEADLRAYGALVVRHVEAHALTRTKSASLASQLQRERDRLDRAARERARFVSLISHELRTPLNAVMGFTDLLEQVGATLTPEEREEYLRQIKQGGERLHSLVEASLRFAATNTTDVTLSCRPLDLNAVIRAAASRHAAAAEERRGTIAVSDNALPPLEADPVHCEEIVAQLVSNAIKFGVPGKTVTIRADLAPSGRQRVVVRNAGGFDELDAQRLTTPFASDASVTTRRGEGLGLGLPLAYRLSRLHGADLTFANDANGAVVELLFPAYRTLPSDAETQAA